MFLDDNDASEVTAQFKVSLLQQLDHDGKLVSSVYTTGTRKTFSKIFLPKDSYGLILPNDLEKSVYFKDDVFSVSTQV